MSDTGDAVARLAALKLVVLALLKDSSLAWEYHGFGFLRLRLSPNVRLHVWDTRAAKLDVSTIHDHLQWGFRSLVVCGQIVNKRYAVGEEGFAMRMQRIRAGVGGGLIGASQLVHMKERLTEVLCEGDEYWQDPDEPHETFAQPGTVTIVTQSRTQVNEARVFWRADREWVSGTPCTASRDQVSSMLYEAKRLLGG